ncbi:unnamed protein product [Ectocarpus sp. 4 AP-2014]
MEPRPASGMRKSCCACGRKKKKCDGFMPCRRCVDSGNCCVYEKRRCHLPRPHQQQRQRRRLDRDGVPLGGGTKHSAPAAAPACEVLTLKRCKFRASPATGLVGMRENTFLGDFFACVGFIPLTTQSHIRETMVKMMVTSTPSRQPVFWRDCDEDNVLAREGDFSMPSAENQLDVGPSICTFWCAVALGALVKRGPGTSVARYSELARDAVESHSGPVTTGVAKAWVILAYLYLFHGDTDVFQEYMARSEALFRASGACGSTENLPVGFPEVVSHRMTVRMFSGDASSAEVESFCRQPQHAPQLNAAASETELYAYMKKAHREFEQAVYRAAYLESSDAVGLPVENEASIGTARSSRVPEASMAVIDTMASRINNRSCDFERLEDVVDRPLIRQGIGGLIINGTLVFEKVAKADFNGAVERIGRCVDVFETFPGVCRFLSHVAHIMVTALAAIRDSRTRGMYDRLRHAYNSTRLPDSSPVPQFEEWQGVFSCCDSFYCRTMEFLIVGEETRSVFSAGHKGCADHQNERDEGEEKTHLGEDEGASWGIDDNDIPIDPFLLSAVGSGVEFDLLPSTCNTDTGFLPGVRAGAGCSPSTAVPRPISGSLDLAQEARAAYPLKSAVEPETGLAAHLQVESHTEMAYGRSNDAGAVTHALGAKFVMEETEEDNIAAADWLDVSHALLVATEGGASGKLQEP